MAHDIVVPDLGESVVEATVARWLKDEGDRVAVGDVLVELETDKVNLEVGAEAAGTLGAIVAPEGQDVQVGDVLGRIEAADAAGGEPQPEPAAEDEQPEEAAEPSQAEETPPLAGRGDGVKVTPVARRMLDEHGIDAAEVAGSGPQQRVTKGDVQQVIAAREGAPDAGSEPATPPTEKQPAPARPAADGNRREERVRMSRRRRTIAARLVEAQQTAAMLTTFNDVDMSAIMDLRERRKEAFQERHGVKLGIASFFVKAAVAALKEFPRLNASIEGDEIVLKHYYDIGVAIGDPEGLVVPVLRDVDRLSFEGIERGIRDFVESAREGTLSIEDLRGGTFSITNGGIFGSLLSTPILNPPQVGILGLHRIEDRPIAVNGEVAIRPMMYVALTYDHRIVDGREAVQFLARIKELVEDPEALLLGA